MNINRKKEKLHPRKFFICIEELLNLSFLNATIEFACTNLQNRSDFKTNSPNANILKLIRLVLPAEK